MRGIHSTVRGIGWAALILCLAADGQAAQSAGGSAATSGENAAKSAAVPESWELSPYRIQVYVRIDAGAEWTAQQKQNFTAQLAPRAVALIGGVWRLAVAAAPPEFPWGHAADPAGIAPDALPAAGLEGDKLILLEIPSAASQIELWTREFDVYTRRWSPPHAQVVEPTADLPQEAIRSLWGVFRPLARIESVGQGDATTIQIRGGGLPAANRGMDLAPPGRIWQPLVRHRDAAGNTIRDGVFALPWTWLQTAKSDGLTAQCRIVAAAENPLELQYDGRTDYLALAVTGRSGTATKLTVLAAGTGERALEDLEVWQRDGGPGSPGRRLLGRTDASGAVTISADSLTLLSVYLRAGDDPLALLPLVPGLEPALTVRVDDNGWRPDSARLVAVAGDQLLEVAAQQRVLVKRLEEQKNAGQMAEAEQTFAALSASTTSEKFIAALEARRSRLIDLAPDTPAAAWLDKQLEALKKLAAQQLLNEVKLSQLRQWLDAPRGK